MALVVSVQENLGYNGNGRRKTVIADLVYTAEAYSSGLALPGASLGLPNHLESVEFVSATPADTAQYKFDASSSKVRIYKETGSTNTAYVEVSGAQTVTIRIQALGW